MDWWHQLQQLAGELRTVKLCSTVIFSRLLVRSLVMRVNIHIVHHNDNKAIRDGKYLAPPHASVWQSLPHDHCRRL